MMVQHTRYGRILAMLDKRQPDLSVLMDHVHKPHNLAAIVRTCDAVGIDHIHAVYPQDRVDACHHTASGSNRWVTVQTHQALNQVLPMLKAENYQLVAAHLSPTAVDFRAIDYSKKTCVVVGAELNGISPETSQVVDRHIVIPMLGMVQSLNVSVATALILYEAQRQREIKGLYRRRRVSLDDYRDRLVAWLHPKVHAYCQEKQLRLPNLNEHGDIDDEEWQRLRSNDT